MGLRRETCKVGRVLSGSGRGKPFPKDQESFTSSAVVDVAQGNAK